MKRIARTLVWWHGIDKDIDQQVRSCLECQRNQASPPEILVQPWHWPTRPWSRVHADFAGPINGQMLFILIDAHSKWIEAHPVMSITATATIRCCRRIFATFGLPEVMVTDNGPTFVSAEFEQFLRKNGIRHKTSAPYHPASNGLAERAVQIVKRGVKKLKLDTLQDKICRFLFSYHNTPQSTTGVTPSELLLGRKMRSPLDLLHPDLYQKVECEQERQMDAKNHQSQTRSFSPGDRVYVRNFARGVTSVHWLPGVISHCVGPASYMIKLSDGHKVRRHINHIRARTDTHASNDDQLSNGITPVPSGISVDLEDQPEAQESDAPSQQPSAETPGAQVSETLRTYPSRNRRPPDRYGPVVSH